MDVSRWFLRETWQLSLVEWLIVVSTFTAVGLVTTTAWASGGASLIFLAGLVAAIRLSGTELKLGRPSTITNFAALALLLSLATLLWAADLYWGVRAFAILLALLTGYLLVKLLLSSLDRSVLTHLTRATLVAFTIFLVYAFIEETTNHAMKRILFWPFQAVTWGAAGPSIDWEHVSRVRAFRTNWNMTTISLLVWPVLWIARHQLDNGPRRLFTVLMIGMTTAAVLQSHHETTMIAFVVGICVFCLTMVLPVRLVAVSIALAWIAIFVAVVPVSQMLFDRSQHLNEELPGSLRHRIVLWKYTADRIEESPLIGVGVGSTRPLDAARGFDLPYIETTNYQLRTGHHPHNIYLQILYEYGIVGCLFVLMWVGSMLMGIARLPQSSAKFYLATVAVATVTSIASFGLYEIWYISAITFTAAMLAAAKNFDSKFTSDVSSEITPGRHVPDPA